MERGTTFRYVREVEFRADDYGAGIASILASAGGGSRLMPLVRAQCVSADAADAVRKLRVPDAVRAGLFLYLGCWDEAHTTADSVENSDGYFWHAIVHRQEPDPANSAYWFRMTGTHAVFPRLAAEASGCGYDSGKAWDPFAFIRFCESARLRAGSGDERMALTVQSLEWQLLFDHCARSSVI